MKSQILVIAVFIGVVFCEDNEIEKTKNGTSTELVPCMCGVFLSGQFKRGSPPKGPPVLVHEYDDNMMCNPMGNKQCVNKCLEVLVKHLANSPSIICGSIDRDCHKERAYLFIKNCNDNWVSSNLSAGREYCCKDGAPYKCNRLG